MFDKYLNKIRQLLLRKFVFYDREFSVCATRVEFAGI